MLSGEDRFRIDAVFEWLREMAGLRTTLATSWCAHSKGAHPTYIRRGALLLSGERRLEALYVIVPPDAEITPTFGHPAKTVSTLPIVQSGGRLIDVTAQEGPWWQKLTEEIGRIEAEIAALRQAASEGPAPAANARDLAAARAAVSGRSARSRGPSPDSS